MKRKYVVNCINQKDKQIEIIIAIYGNKDLYKHEKMFYESNIIKFILLKSFLFGRFLLQCYFL